MVPCPNCGKPAEYSASNAFRPFCCERCRILDLGNWADERYGIPSDSQEESAENPEQKSESGDESDEEPS